MEDEKELTEEELEKQLLMELQQENLIKIKVEEPSE